MAVAAGQPALVTGPIAGRLGRILRTRDLGPRATAVALAVTTRIVTANGIAGLLVAIYLTISENVRDTPNAWVWTIVANVIFYVAAMVVLTIIAVIRGKHSFAPAWRFLDDDRPVSDADRVALLRLPAKMAFFPVPYWIVAAALGVTTRIALGGTAGQVVASGVTLLVGGLVAATAGFLLGERALRPVFAIAMQGQTPPGRPRLGIGTRLVVTWVLGSGLPLALIGVSPFLVRDADLGVTWAILTLAAIGLVSGYATTVAAARSISRPLAGVRRALGRVGEGELDLAVVVDDGGELGHLQAGVNEMVGGLRERARLEDLFGRHVGGDVARLAMQEEETALGGELRDISVLFVDVRGSTELARRRSPHEVVELLNRFFAAVVEACDTEGGWLDKFEGDGAMCVFGAPIDRADHADRALRTSRALAARLRALRADEPDLDAGIGVASGEAVVGYVGTEWRLEYTVIGDPVNTAARLTVAAKDRPGRVLASTGALASASPAEAAWWQPAGEVDLKGLAPAHAVSEPRPLEAEVEASPRVDGDARIG
jgi:adenylate cyclase